MTRQAPFLLLVPLFWCGFSLTEGDGARADRALWRKVYPDRMPPDDVSYYPQAWLPLSQDSTGDRDILSQVWDLVDDLQEDSSGILTERRTSRYQTSQPEASKQDLQPYVDEPVVAKRMPPYYDPYSFYRRSGQCPHEKYFCPSPDADEAWLCINDFQLCNGMKDCPNGEDEDLTQCLFYDVVKGHLDKLARGFLENFRNRGSHI